MKTENKISYCSPHLLAKLPKNTSVLVAFSGGADSSALLNLLVNDSHKNGFIVHAAHFNHGIRGKEADCDAEFCKAVAESHNIPFHLGYADIPALAKANGNSVEAEARAQRYAFFEKVMRENNIPILVTAHHAEDNVESILINIIRGCGISGLKGILPHRTFAENFHLVRPILESQKQDILEYCKANNIEFVFDSTNEDKNYLRNAIRSDVTPKLEELQPNLSDMFLRLSKSASESDDYINSLALAFIDKECCDGSVSVAELINLHDALKSRVISLLFERECDTSLERVHIESVIELCKKATPHSSISLPNKAVAKIEEGRLIFTNENDFPQFEDFEIPFREGKTELPNGISINIEKNPTENIAPNSVFIDVKCGTLNDKAHFRSKKDGDVIFSGNMNKKVKKLLNEKKISLKQRKRLPFFVIEDEILWIPTVAVCDRIKRDKIKGGEDFFRITITL